MAASRWCFLGLLTGFFLLGPVEAPSQSLTRTQLLSLVPEDAGFCLVLQDYRGQAKAWTESAWVQAVAKSPLGQAVIHSPEARQLDRLKGELKRRLEIDWPTLRDDILGDLVVLSYRPAMPDNKDHEQGLLLVQPRRPELLARVLERLDIEQKKAGELKEVETLEYKGVSFKRRVDVKSTLYVMLADGLFAASSRERVIRDVIDRKMAGAADKSTLVKQIERAGADKALLTLWVNPRAFDAELEQQASKEASQKERVVLQAFLNYWRPLDAVVVTLNTADDYTLKMSLQARPKELPAGARKLFSETAQSSDVWSRFPENAVLAVGDRVDLTTFVDSLADFSPPGQRQQAQESLQKTLGAALGLDLKTEVLPNIGPDWGFYIAAADKSEEFPHALAALAVKPGSGDTPVDDALLRGVRFLANLLVFDYNRKNANPIRMKKAMQGDVDVRYVVNEKDFPAGLQPAFALKDGYLLLATSPDAIARFKAEASKTPPEGVAMLGRLSPTKLADLLRGNRKQVMNVIVEKNKTPASVAAFGFDTLLSVLDLVDEITISQSATPGQATWTARLKPHVFETRR